MEFILKSNSYRLLKNKIDELTDGINKDNIIYYDLSIDNINEIIEECNYVSLFLEKKAVIVNNTNIFNTKFEYKNELDMLEKYLNNPNPNTILIFICDSISLKKKCVKIINDKNNIIEININEEDVSEKVKDYLKSNNFKIDNKALNKLVNNLNKNYDYILNELDKIIIVKKDYLITLDDINKYCINISQVNIFDFIDFVIKKDINKVFKYLNDIIEVGVEVSIILSNLATQYRLIYCVKNMMNENNSEEEIAKKLNVHPYRVKLSYQSSFNYSNSELEEKILRVGDLDEKIKLGLIDKYNALKLFFVSL